MNKITSRFTSLYICFLLFTTISIAQVTNGDDSGPGSLRDAIVSANSNSDTNIIEFENSNITVVLTSGPIAIVNPVRINGAINTEIDGNQNIGSIFNIADATNVVFNDISFINSNTNDDGGVIASSNASISIYDCSFFNNSAISGGAVFMTNTGDLTIANSIFFRNIASGPGGAIEFGASGSVSIDNTVFENNRANGSLGNGGAIHLTTSPLFLFSNGSMINNRAANDGGGIWNNQGSLDIDNVLMNGNSAMGDGSANGGGAIFNNGGSINIRNFSNIIGNSATGIKGSGGAFYCNGGSIEILDAIIKTNSAQLAGGAFHIKDGTATLKDCLIKRNDAGALVPNFGLGGAISASGNSTVIQLKNSKIEYNFASNEGGAIYNEIGATTIIKNCEINNNEALGDNNGSGGGAVSNYRGSLKIFNNSRLEYNMAKGIYGSGGGILNKGGSLTVIDAIIENNSANNSGGGVKIIDGTVFFFKSDFNYNDVNRSSETPNPGNGGGMHISGDSAVVTIFSCNISYNEAAQDGGGMYNSIGSEIFFKRTAIAHNISYGSTSDTGGGGIFNAGFVQVGTSTVSNNVVPNGGNGGGIFNAPGARAQVNRSTVSNNNTQMGIGGGIYNIGNSCALVAATIADNIAAQTGGGVASYGNRAASVSTSIISNNSTIENFTSLISGSNLSGDFLSKGYNLIGIDELNIFNSLENDLMGLDPMLDPLDTNGGQTLTHELHPLSPAIDTGSPENGSLDQIGQFIVGPRRDIGAYEAQLVFRTNPSVASNNRQHSELEFHMYPNPSTGITTLNILTNTTSDYKIQVLELASGKTVVQFSTISTLTNMDLRDLDNGIYLVMVTSEKEAGVQKLIVSK